jgi:hypothetical protein
MQPGKAKDAIKQDVRKKALMCFSQGVSRVSANYLVFERATQEKVLFHLLFGLLFVACGQANSINETQVVSPQTPTSQAAAPTSQEIPKTPHKTNAFKNQWSTLEPGLDYAEFTSPTPSEIGDSVISVVRVDPKKFSLMLVSASHTKDKKIHTAKEWSQTQGLVAAINASMYQTDYLTSVHHLESLGHINNPRALRENTVLVFDPKEKTSPAAQILDASCEDLKVSAAKYQSQIEGIRMLSCEGKNVWKAQDKKWSHAVIGEDKKGNILLIHCRSPFSTHDFINILLGLPLNLINLQYAEGGPEAQLYLKVDNLEREKIGSFETNFLPDDSNLTAWPVPNILGVKRK